MLVFLVFVSGNNGAEYLIAQVMHPSGFAGDINHFVIHGRVNLFTGSIQHLSAEKIFPLIIDYQISPNIM